MRIPLTLAAITVAAFSISFTQPSVSNAAPKKSAAAQEISWDGTWAGKWGGKSSAKVTVKGNKVTSYYYNGRPQKVGATKVNGKTLAFGSGYSVRMTMSGPTSAHAIWKGDGTAEAQMTKR